MPRLTSPAPTSRLRAAARHAAACLAAACLAGAAASPAAAQITFSNPTLIGIPSSGAATLYPSPISVTGSVGALLSIQLNNFSHTYLRDLDIVVVGPTNRAIYLMHQQGGRDDAQTAFVTYADGEAAYVAGNIVGAPRYRPTGLSENAAAPYNGGTLPGSPTFVDTFAELVAAGTTGTYSLYVYDGSSGDGGVIAEGWSATFADPAAGPPASTVPEPSTYTLLGAGVLALGGAARRRGWRTA